jgi:tetratricopeptide (TPR) repeat protein
MAYFLRHSNEINAHSATGLALMYAGRAAEALEAFALSKRLDPHYPSIVLHYLAQANFSLGNYGTAAKQLLERIARTPGTDSSRMMLAACYGNLGRLEEARAAWAELLKVNPDFSLEQRERVLPYKDPRDFARERPRRGRNDHRHRKNHPEDAFVYMLLKRHDSPPGCVVDDGRGIWDEMCELGHASLLVQKNARLRPRTPSGPPVV